MGILLFFAISIVQPGPRAVTGARRAGGFHFAPTGSEASI
jgi:hypothetical protein